MGYPGEQEPETHGELPEDLDISRPEALADFVASQATQRAPECETVFVCVIPKIFTRRFCGDLCARLFALLPHLEHVFVQPRSALAFVGMGIRSGVYVNQ